MDNQNDLQSFFFPKRQRPRERRAMGSGVILSKEGLVVTNDHVIGTSPDLVEILLANGPAEKSYEAEIVSRDPMRDLALLQITDPPKNLTAVKMGRTELCHVGDRVFAVGNNLGFTGTVTDGIISAIGRTQDPRLPFRAPLIQTNACINPGSSGGALFNVKGELVGVNESIITNTGTNIGIGFAIPVNFLVPLMRNSADDYDEPFRVWDGLTVCKDGDHVSVKDVHKDAPGYSAGIRKGDKLLQIDDVKDLTVEKHSLMITSSPPDSKRSYQIKRGDKTHTFIVAPTKLDSPAEPVYIDDQKNPFSGAVVTEMCPALALDFGLDLSKTGVVILEIEPNSFPHQLRLKVGDIVLKVNRKKIQSIEDLQKCSLRRFGHIPKQMKIVVLRGEKKITREFVISPKWRRLPGAKL